MLGFARALGDYGMTQMVASARFDGLSGSTNDEPGVDLRATTSSSRCREDAARNMAIATTLSASRCCSSRTG